MWKIENKLSRIATQKLQDRIGIVELELNSDENIT